ncbi:nuclear transport factor 2 family protein [Corallococcus praedator]|uniref:Nuclear transport factor 2 family protein n=1 Tax=Corallococcus praedator TaxID=2316724 RepID=A0ABX9QD24_9BACT|nr:MULTISPECIES: nuclear transport factor 2 family protein [Corallococcus]RKH09362.1 nuclear transport factor 2 family protein [Corallococcus sp. CA047B]RKH24658.1 nuclear transport factor 2 family protein [Corallococcus sp. CA031C]RKI00890.1 nuclear transport factor 2 family protein [Corallococcus praedator]
MSRLLVACAVLLGASSAFAQAPAAPAPKAAPTAPASKAAPTAPAATKPDPRKAVLERTQAGLAQLPAPKPEDVKSIDSLLKALYDVISGPGGTPRDWQRFRSLFYPGATLVPLVHSPTAPGLHARPFTPEEYIALATGASSTQGFFEKETQRQSLGYGDLVQVMSTYEARGTPDGPVIAKGVNSIQVFNDGQRWWVMHIVWLDEKTSGLKVPADLTRK